MHLSELFSVQLLISLDYIFCFHRGWEESRLDAVKDEIFPWLEVELCANRPFHMNYILTNYLC